MKAAEFPMLLLLFSASGSALLEAQIIRTYFNINVIICRDVITGLLHSPSKNIFGSPVAGENDRSVLLEYLAYSKLPNFFFRPCWLANQFLQFQKNST